MSPHRKPKKLAIYTDLKANAEPYPRVRRYPRKALADITNLIVPAEDRTPIFFLPPTALPVSDGNSLSAISEELSTPRPGTTLASNPINSFGFHEPSSPRQQTSEGLPLRVTDTPHPGIPQTHTLIPLPLPLRDYPFPIKTPPSSPPKTRGKLPLGHTEGGFAIHCDEDVILDKPSSSPTKKKAWLESLADQENSIVALKGHKGKKKADLTIHIDPEILKMDRSMYYEAEGGVSPPGNFTAANSSAGRRCDWDNSCGREVLRELKYCRKESTAEKKGSQRRPLALDFTETIEHL